MSKEFTCPCCGSKDGDMNKLAAFLIEMLMAFDPGLKPYLIREFHRRENKEE